MNYNKQILLKILSVFETEIEEGTFCLFIKDAYIGPYRRCNLAWGEPYKSAFSRSNATLYIKEGCYIDREEYKEILNSIENDTGICRCIVLANKELVYYMYMNHGNEYIIGISSNLMGRSNANLLSFNVSTGGIWHLQPMQINGAESREFDSVDKLFDYIIDIISAFGDPYKPHFDQRLSKITLDVNKAEILQDEHSWFSF